MLKPAPDGTGVIAWCGSCCYGTSGVRDIRTKSLGSDNPNNVVNATMEALRVCGHLNKLPVNVVRASKKSFNGRGNDG